MKPFYCLAILLATFGLLTTAAAAQGSKKRDPYRILGIPKSAQNRQIKKAFRANSKKYHPDLNPNDPEAERNFKDSAWAYEVLTNDTLRQAYDKFGEEGVNRLQQGGPPPGGGMPRDFPFMFTGGHPFFGGGGPGGFPFNDPFGGGGRRRRDPFGGEDMPQPVDWFEETSVDFFIGAQGNLVEMMTNEMSDVWPDVVMVFRRDTETEELAAKAFSSVAEQLDSSFTFAAVDCRARGPPSFFCGDLAQMSGPQAPAIRYMMLTAKHFERRVSSRPVMTKGKLTSEELIDWIFRHAPQPRVSFSTRASLAKHVNAARDAGVPAVILLPNEEPCALKIRKLAIEQQGRALFAVVHPTSASATLRKALLDGAGVSKALREQSLMMLVTDATALTPKTTSVESLEVNDLAIDLTLAKFVGFAKQQIGPYLEALTVARRLTAESMRKGECGASDPNTCILFFTSDPDGQRAAEVHGVYTKTANKSMRFYILSLKEQSVRTFLRSFIKRASSSSSSEQLVAYRPKRKKYLVPREGRSLESFFESVVDSSSFLREGEKLESHPTLAESSSTGR